MSCIVRNCTSVWTPKSDIKFHYFPKDPIRRATWLALIPLKGKFYESARICSLHFKPTDRDVDRSGRLSKTANPYYLPKKCDHDPIQTHFPLYSSDSNIEQQEGELLQTESNDLKENYQCSPPRDLEQDTKPSGPGTSNLLLALLTAKRQEPERSSLQKQYKPPAKRPRMKDFDMQVRLKSKLEIKLQKRSKILLQKISRQEKKLKDMELKIVNILQGKLYSTTELSNHSTPNDDNIFEEKLSGDLIKEKRRIRDDNSTHDIDFPVDEDSRQSHGDLDDNDFNCTEVEYLEDADSDGSDDTADIKRENHTRLKQPDTEDPTIMFDQDFKLTLDDVDFLFLSYARTFRSLAKQFQTMLKLDIAKLFARYEMKNSMNTEEGSKREEPASESVKPSPVEIDPPPAVTPPESVVKPPQFVVKPTQYVVKPSQFTHQTAVGPTQPVVQPSPDKVANFIPAKEANKKIFRRVPLQSVMSGVIAKTITSSPQAILVPQVKQAEPKETVNTPQVILVPPSREAASQQTELPQISQTNELEKNTAKTYIRVGSVPKQFDPTVNIERLKTDVSMLSSQSESLQPPAPKVMKYFVPKKGPAYAIFSKDSVSLQQETLDPDLDMEVTGRVRTETVFVPTDHVGYCEEEEAGDSSDSSS